MVRTYHPDQYKDDKAEGNRRLAELNAAFDLVSDWSRAQTEAAQACYAAQAAAQARKAATQRAAEAKRAAAERKKQADLKAQARKQQSLDEAAARKRAAELDRQEALRRATSDVAEEANGPQTRARNKFLVALSHLATQPTNRLSFSL